MRITQIRKLDISNGEGIGISLFVQGCHFHCKGCFNAETWNFNGGKEWTHSLKEDFIRLAGNIHVNRVSLLGGEPLADENVDDIAALVGEMNHLYPDKSIWLYTGYTVDYIDKKYGFILKPSARDFVLKLPDYQIMEMSCKDQIRGEIISKCDVLVDGKYIDGLRDLTLKWKGSKNQRVIDVQQSIAKGMITLWE